MSDNVKLDQFTSTLKGLIENYHMTIDHEEVGVVITNSDGVLNVGGIKNCQLNEILEVGNGMFAIALNLRENMVGAVMLSDFDSVKEGMKVKRTNKTFSAPYGDSLLGRTINVFGKPIDEFGDLKEEGWLPAERIAPSVMERKSVDEPLYTGILIIDALIPIGKGQRELIIGDRQTGKTTIAIDSIINQKSENCYCIYVSIGQKNSTLSQTIAKLQEKNAMSYTTVVSAPASDLPALQFLAPFVGITIAEHWMRKGKDVLIIYDDLTQHAIAYRTLSLLLGFPPGREAFPGDIFYLHSRLLERAGRLAPEYGGGSITALPIVQTQSDDIAAYIPSNVISITDGQIFLKTALFNAGQKPAIDITLSVSRVGGAAQKKSIKSVCSTLKLELAQYYELLEFSKFGSDLNEQTKYNLMLGERILKILIQQANSPYSPKEELFLLYLIKQRHVMKIHEVEKMVEFIAVALEEWRNHPEFEKFSLSGALTDEVTQAFEGIINKTVVPFLKPEI